MTKPAIVWFSAQLNISQNKTATRVTSEMRGMADDMKNQMPLSHEGSVKPAFTQFDH